MRIAEIVAQFNDEHLALLDSSQYWKQEIQSTMIWADRLKSAELVSNAMAKLHDHAIDVLRTICMRFGAVPTLEETVHRQVCLDTERTGLESRMAMQQLEEAGFVFAVRRSWGERLLFIARDCFPIWHRLLFPKTITASQGVVTPRMDDSQQYIGNKIALGKQLLYVMSVCARLELRYTSKGMLPKKTINKIMDQLQLREEIFVPFGLKVKSEAAYPIQVSFVLEALCALGILNQQGHGLVVNDVQLVKWILLPAEIRERQLMRWVVDFLLIPSQSGANAVSMILGLPEAQWFSLQEVDQSIPYCSDSKQAVQHWTGNWAKLFHSLGWMELGETNNDGVCIGVMRWRSSSNIEVQEEASVYVQPNGELLAYPTCSFAIRWELELLCERMYDQELTNYQLTKGSVKRAFEYGRTSLSILTFLQEISGGDALPISVLTMIQQWTDQLHLNIPFVQQTYVSYPEYERRHSNNGEQLFVVYDDVISGQPLFIEPPETSRYIELDIPKCESFAILQQWDQIPKIWTEQLRQYHHSTRKEIMLKAVELETSVGLKLNDGVRIFIPEQIEQLGDDWIVNGKMKEGHRLRRCQISSDMGEGMQILLPVVERYK